MDEIFGISMTAITTVLVSLLVLCLLSVVWVAWRRPVIFKLGVRNIPRRRAQTLLIVVGLMLSTLIITAALGIGDTVDNSVTSETYDILGPIDEIVVASQNPEANANNAAAAPFDAALLSSLETRFAGDDQIDGFLPLLNQYVPVRNETKQQTEPNVPVIGVDPSRIGPFGAITDVKGMTVDLAALPGDGIVLGKGVADDLDAAVGDRIAIFYNNTQIPLTVAAIAEDTFLSGKVNFETSGMTMSLAGLQGLTGLTDKVTAIAVSNQGGTRDGAELSTPVSAKLRAALADQPYGVDSIKQRTVDLAKTISSVFSGLFLVLGLFSIAAGVLLIVLIFTMLAAERRPEMGMERAIGAQRGQLIQQFIAEGAGYALAAGVVGAALGVLATIELVKGLVAIIGEDFPISMRISPRTIVASYALGVVITFLAVTVSSWRISRLNVVAAVRDIPDVSSPTRKWSTLVWAGLLLIVGTILTASGHASASAALFYAGASLLPFGVAMVLRFFGVPSRPVFSLIGVYLLVLWLLPSDLADRLFGTLDGDFEMFFLSGVFMVIGATIVIVQNLDILLAGVSRLGGLFQSRLPAVRTAIAYPGAAKGRTGLTIAMFSLIVFSLVMMATMNRNFTNLFLGDEANAGWDVRVDVGNANPVADLTAALQARGVDTTGFRATGVATTPDAASQLRQAGEKFKAYPVHGVDGSFLSSSTVTFQQRADGYADDAAVIRALQTEPGVAVLDAAAVPGGGFGDPDQFTVTGLKTTDKSFTPINLEVSNPGGTPATLKVIGVIDSKISSLVGLYTPQGTVDPLYPTVAETSYYVALNDPGASKAVAKSIEAALLSNGAQATSIKEKLKEDQRQSTGFLYLIQGFMGLGLLVGIAAVGVIAFRNVVERRQQIGVLRALGYQKAMVSLSFLIETGFVVGIGVIAGTLLGVLLARNLFTSDDIGTSTAAFTIPWPIISVILVATMVVALLMAWVPSRQAASIAPAEALRYE